MTVPAAVLTEIRTLRAESVPSWPAVSLAERQTLLRAERGRDLRGGRGRAGLQEALTRSSTESGWEAIIGPSPDGSATPSSTHAKRPSSTACAAA